jgi:hypothetical protein
MDNPSASRTLKTKAMNAGNETQAAIAMREKPMRISELTRIETELDEKAAIAARLAG